MGCADMRFDVTAEAVPVLIGASRRAGTLAPARLGLGGVSVRIGGVTVLDAVDLELTLEGRTVVIGPNGAGKTTLMQLIQGLIQPTTGEVRATARGDAGVRPRFAFVFQEPVMLRRCALANIEHALTVAGVPRAQRAERAQAALAEVGLAWAADRPARRLSGGEQQRLAIARANALDPDCLLLDEPTSSLDPGAAAAIERHLIDVSARGRGVVMSTHDLAQARRLGQRIVFMHRGRVVECADAPEFFERPRSDAARRFLAGEWLE